MVIVETTLKDKIISKIAGATGSISGGASVLGSWQICHNVCLGIVALLSIIGITITGMPLAFLTTVAVPMWIIALGLFMVVFALHLSRKCISPNLLIINFGLIIAGFPFSFIGRYEIIFWIIGGAFVFAGVTLYIRNKVMARKCEKCVK